MAELMASQVQVIPMADPAPVFIHRVSWSRWTFGFLLQTSHRLGAISFFAAIASWAMLYKSQNPTWAVAVSFGAADLGLCAGLIALLMLPKRESTYGETRGAIIFNLLFVLLALQMIFITRLPVIRDAVTAFFTPT